MVAVHAINEIARPADVIRRIFRDAPDDLRSLPAAVAKHFAAVLADASLPPLDVTHPPESHTPGTVVRFRAMIQDTSIQSEIYLARIDEHECGGWGMQPTPSDDYEVDSGSLATATVFWGVSVPGESPWRADDSAPTSFPAHCPSQPHKFPIPSAPHIGVRLKIYDNDDVDSLHSTNVVTFIGMVSSEPLNAEDDTSPEVPVLHVLCYQVASADRSPSGLDVAVRNDLVDWISREALGGDSDAAEWLLLQLTSKVHSRAIPLLPPSLTISRFPQPSSPELVPTLSHVLAELLPQYLTIPLSLELLNKAPFLPESKEEDLHSGYLQLPAGTTVLLTENAIQEGNLFEKGIMNVRAIQDVMNSQTIEYIFPFSARFAFHTDLSMIVVSEGRTSALFQTSINVPLRRPPTVSTLYKRKDEVSVLPPQKLATYRSYIAACRAICGTVQVTEETSKYIQDDFVRRRQQDKSVTADELIHLMKVARLLAASRLQSEVTVDLWEQAKGLDSRRCSAG